MLEAMRQLALDWLFEELAGDSQLDPEGWYRRLLDEEASRLFPKLVEPLERCWRSMTFGRVTSFDFRLINHLVRRGLHLVRS